MSHAFKDALKNFIGKSSDKGRVGFRISKVIQDEEPKRIGFRVSTSDYDTKKHSYRDGL